MNIKEKLTFNHHLSIIDDLNGMMRVAQYSLKMEKRNR